jgi:Uma2 family endonuclease
MATSKRKRRYPSCDYRQMAETELHRDEMTDCYKTLRLWYRDTPMVYVGCNLLLYFEEGNQRQRIAPDNFVVFGVEQRLRDNYLLWEEKKSPSVIIETTSGKTRREDMEKKLPVYRDVLKVEELFFFDPLGSYLHPRLKGYRLENGQYIDIDPLFGRLPSEKLGLELTVYGVYLYFFNPVKREWLKQPKFDWRYHPDPRTVVPLPFEQEMEEIRHYTELLRQKLERLQQSPNH